MKRIPCRTLFSAHIVITHLYIGIIFYYYSTYTHTHYNSRYFALLRCQCCRYCFTLCRIGMYTLHIYPTISFHGIQFYFFICMCIYVTLFMITEGRGREQGREKSEKINFYHLNSHVSSPVK